MPDLLSRPLNDPQLSIWVEGFISFVLWIGLFWIAKRILFSALRRVALRTSWSWDDVLVRALSLPTSIAIAASVLLLLDRILPLSPEWDRGFDVLFAFSVVLALVLFLDRVTSGVLDRLTRDSIVLQGARGLIQGVVRGVIIGLGLLIFLDSLGISITPLLASLGVGSLAVALALQETLANLFAGIYMVVDKPIEPGHLVKLENVEEGTIVRLGWRSTWIRTLANSIVVVPNTKLAGSVITNYSLLDPQVATNVNITLHGDSDLETVERVTLDVAREVMRNVEGGVRGFEPSARLQSFGESGLNLVVVLRAADFPGIARVRHEFIKRLTARYRSEKIQLAFPTRTVTLTGDAGAGPRLSGR